ncbi:Malate/L-lactate dehydrogenase family protein [Sulfitobacter noctilucae]|uniref:Ldh family oxidoreductase n=1 Tax=Sulfitobacter noctilucae TaxID=1342302 RepID=UPI000469B043|nr:Ldh family oxidoreductase [Sulfitobacter noctilucae]KIN61680.1 Malate/L-lactate dehydrogenase family protein [Sulfitobacter noctilucae]
MVQVSLAIIEETVKAALLTHGAEAFPAAEVARAVAAAEAIGNKICGLYYVESYCQQLTSGRVKGDVTPNVTTPRSATVHVDAQFGFAQPAFAYGLPVALDAARQAGIASLAVGHAHTCTSLGYFTEQIARSGFIGIGFTNASPIVAAPGGKTRVIGTNPIAFSVPDGAGGIAMQFDQSTTTVALGKITMAKAAGQTIPEGWAVDAEGNPTTDPDSALKGSLVSMGGYKGWGFGLMAEILAAGLAGGVLSQDVKPLKAPEGAPHDLGQYYIVIDPASASGFGTKLAALTEAASADDDARMPGQNKEVMDPVEIEQNVWDLMEKLASTS